MYTIKVKPRAQRAWQRLPANHFQSIREALDELAQNARPRGVEKLSGEGEDPWRIRRGDYRVVYSIYDSERLIIVRRIGHRREVYKGFSL